MLAALATQRGQSANDLMEDANRAYALAARVNPRDAETQARRGAVLDEIGRLAEALECFEKAMSPQGGNTPGNRAAAERLRERIGKR